MQKGNLIPSDPAVPLSWTVSEPEVEAVLGFKPLRGAEGQRISEAFARVKDSRATVWAYHCAECGVRGAKRTTKFVVLGHLMTSINTFKQPARAFLAAS